MKILLRLISLFLLESLLLLAFSVQGQTLSPKITTYLPDDFNSHAQVFSTDALSKGRRAFGTVRQVFVHDGESFSHTFVGSGKAVFSMDRDSTGRLFVGGGSLMGVIVPDSIGALDFRSLIPLLPDSLKDFGTVWKTYCDGEGGVYFNAQQQELFYFKDDTIRQVRPEKEFYQMHHPSGRPVVQDLGAGLFALSGTEKTYLPGSKFFSQGKGVVSILPASPKDGTWMVFTAIQGIYRYDPDEGVVERPRRGEDASPVLKGVEVNTATRLEPQKNPYGAAYAVGTELGGLYLLSPEGELILHLGRKKGLPANYVWELSVGRTGNLWATTNNGIALVHLGLPFTVTEEGRLFRGGVTDIARGMRSDREGSNVPDPLVLTTLQGAWWWQKEEGTFSRISGSGGQCFDVHPFSFGRNSSRILIGGGNTGLLSTALPPRGKVDPDRKNAYEPFSIKAIPVNGRKGVLLGGRKGLYVIAPDRVGGSGWKKLLSLKELPQEIYSVGWEQDQGASDSLTIWAGMSSKGILQVRTDPAFRDPLVMRYDTGDGLPEGPVRVFDAPSKKEGGVLFGTDEGLYQFGEGMFTPFLGYGRIFGNGSRPLFGLEKGLKGEMWINDATGGRIKHLLPEGEGYRVDSTVFRVLDLGAVRAIHSEKGRTWIGGDKGLACYFPDMEKDWDREWDCLLRKVWGSGDSLLFGGNFSKVKGQDPKTGNREVKRIPVDQQPREMVPKLPYSANRMEFEFAAPFTDRQEVVEYSYRLRGFDTAWSKWTDETKKEYTNLPEGRYNFKVKARNVYLKESSTAEYQFRILPPWYRTWTAYGGYTAAGIGFIWLVLWLNSRRLVAQKQRLEKIVNDRTKEIREQKERVEEQQKETEKQKEKVEEAHQEITQSIDYAQKIQYALLQSEEHVSPHLPEHFILFKPQSQVSGDFYWAREQGGYFYIAAVDCTGHGVPGAFMSMLGISQINEIMNTEKTPTPGYVLTELRTRIVRELSGSDPESAAKDGMDAALVKIPNPNSRSQIPSGEEDGIEVQFAGAQNPLYVIRKGIAEEPLSASMEYQGELLEGDPVRPFRKSSDGIEIKGDAQPVGHDKYAKEAFTTVKLQLQKEDMLYFFSDGYADQFGGSKGKKFRYGPFKQLLVNLHQKPLEKQKQELDKTFEDWKEEGQQEQIDDVIVIGVRL